MRWRRAVVCVVGSLTLAVSGACASTPHQRTTATSAAGSSAGTAPSPEPSAAPGVTPSVDPSVTPGVSSDGVVRPGSEVTAARAAAATGVHLTAAGDYASTSNTSAVLRALKIRGSDAHLALGDLSYGVPGQEPAWCSFVTSRVGPTLPFELVSGNHESNGLNGSIARFAACLPNRLAGLVGQYARQYYVDLPRAAPLVRVVAISPALTFPDGTWRYTAGSARYAWTAAAIDGARRAGIRWVVVAMHEPCLSVGRYGCTVGPDLMHLLVAKRVDLVLTGHEHLYQRTKQLREGAGCPRVTVGAYTPACVADADSSMVARAGTVFATVGTGGVALRPVSTTDPERGYFAAASGGGRNPTYGYGDLRVTATELRFSFVRGAGGTFTDNWTLRHTP